MVRGLNDMYMENYRNTGAEFTLGTGRFLAPRTVQVTLAAGTTRQLRGSIMTDLLDFKESPIGLEADLSQLRQVVNPLANIEVPGVV